MVLNPPLTSSGQPAGSIPPVLLPGYTIFTLHNLGLLSGGLGGAGGRASADPFGIVPPSEGPAGYV